MKNLSHNLIYEKIFQLLHIQYFHDLLYSFDKEKKYDFLSLWNYKIETLLGVESIELILIGMCFDGSEYNFIFLNVLNPGVSYFHRIILYPLNKFISNDDYNKDLYRINSINSDLITQKISDMDEYELESINVLLDSLKEKSINNTK